MPKMTLTHSFKRFLRDESGVLLAEALILLPLLIWGFLALFVYWDVFRSMNVAQKAAYSVADLLSRQAEVTPEFVDGMQDVLNFLTQGSPQSKLRITSLQYNGATDKYELLFSRSPGGKMTAHTDVTIQTLKTKIPVMASLDSVIIVETEVDYNPTMDTGVLNVASGVTSQTFREFIVTRPRFWRRVCMTPLPPICS